jgi:molybdopterin molybdotransferase
LSRWKRKPVTVEWQKSSFIGDAWLEPVPTGDVQEGDGEMTMLSYDQALDLILRAIQSLPPQDRSLAEGLGRLLAEPVAACWDLPPADNSAMDGFAFACSGQRPGDLLPVIGFVPAGRPFQQPVPAGAAVKIMTGAPLPAGCDTVLPLEEVSEEDGAIRLQSSPRPGQHVRRRGEEMRQGEVILPAGTTLRAGDVGLLAAAGRERLRVHPTPVVALLSTGDELVELGQHPAAGQIINSNAHLLTARLREEGCTVLSLGIARDQPQELSAAIGQGLAGADLLLTTGGVSVGDCDHVQQVLQAHGFTLGFWKVAIKPGKPVLFGTAAGKPVFALPGNPAAAAVTFELFVRPALRQLGGYRNPLPPRVHVVLAAAIDGGEKRQRFLWGSLQEEGGRFLFHPSGRQGSGQHRSLQGATALLPVPANSQGLAAGQEVEAILLYWPV